MMIDLGILRSHSRPRTSNDNPFSEAQFKTLKYVPDFPDRFGSLADARAFCDRFFPAYNHEHRHSGIGMHTPATRGRPAVGPSCANWSIASSMRSAVSGSVAQIPRYQDSTRDGDGSPNSCLDWTCW